MNKITKGLLVTLFIIILLATLVYAYKINGDLEVTGSTQTERVIFENDTINHYIDDNATCIRIYGDTSELAIC